MKKLLMLCLTLTMLLALAVPAYAAGDYELTGLTVGSAEVDIDGETLFARIGRNATEIQIIADDDDDSDDVIKMVASAGTLTKTGSGKYTLSLPVGKSSAIITITVSSPDNGVTNSYELALLRTNAAASLQALLKDLVINTDDSLSRGVKLLRSADFDPGETEYEIYVDEADGYESVYLWLTPLGGDVEVYVDGDRVKPSKYSGYEVELDYGDKQHELEIEVVYDEEDEITTVYTVTFTFDKTVESNSSLEELLVSRKASDSASKRYTVYPKFDAKTLDYYAFLPEGDDSAYVLLAPAEDEYYIEYEGDELIEETGDYYYQQLTDIEDGDSFEFLVYDEDDELLDTYTVTFYCGDSDDDDEAALDELSLRYKTGSNSYDKVNITPGFDPDDTAYTATVAVNSYNKIRVYAEAADNGAHLLVNGKPVNEDGYADLDVVKGKNVVTVNVVAENCEDSETYTLTVTYGTPVVSATTLSSLLARTSLGTDLGLSPAFSSNLKSYTASVANTVSAVALNPTAAEGANIYYGATKLESGVYSNYLPLKEGINNLTLTVSGQGAASTVYYLTVYRQPAQVSATVSSQGLTVNGTAKKLYAYNINGNNFVKLRDLAYAINGTAKQFAVSFDQNSNTIYLTSNSPYVSNGQENVKLSAPRKVAATTQLVYQDNAAINPMAYNIDGNNYVMLRDIGLLFNFSVTYNSATKTILIDTSSSYSPLS